MENQPEVRVEYQHAGLPCMICQNDLGIFCGYVSVPPGHPAHGKDYDTLDLGVHGGLSFAAAPNDAIYMVGKGKPEGWWVLGFDCGHFGDFDADVQNVLRTEKFQSVRDTDFVRRQTNRLAKQLAMMVETGISPDSVSR